MAGTSLLALIDDIATILDDVAVLSKVAAKKTTGVLGDDLALNAEQVSGVAADRELPVVYAVAKGSFVNKVILVPSALVISAFTPWLVTPLMMVGGSYLAFEGFEKVFEKFFHKKAKTSDPHPVNPTASLVPVEQLEKEKIKGAIRTDFILSAEIIVITLGSVAHTVFLTRVLVLSGISIAMTVGVYGLVALVVKIDDMGLYLCRKDGVSSWVAIQKKFGAGLLKTAPLLMKGLGIAGTVAMFLVGGGILSHSIPFLHHTQQNLSGGMSVLFDGAIGALAGGIIFVAVTLFKKIRGAFPENRAA